MKVVNENVVIDGIDNNIDGYDIKLVDSENETKVNTYNHYQVRFLKEE